MQPNLKDFDKAFDFFMWKLENRENFAFSRFSDGELFILQNKHVLLAEDHYITGNIRGHGVYTEEEQKEYDPKNDEHNEFRIMLSTWFTLVRENYFRGICTPTDAHVGQENFDWMMRYLSGDDTNLTFSNLLINANYSRFIEEMVPLFSDREVVYICNKLAKLDNLPFKVKKDFRVGSNCMINDQHVVEEVREYLDDKSDHIVLCSAASLSNLIIGYGFTRNDRNTFLDIGSCLNPYLGLEGWKHTRGYLTSYWMGSGSPFGKQKDVWGNVD